MKGSTELKKICKHQVKLFFQPFLTILNLTIICLDGHASYRILEFFVNNNKENTKINLKSRILWEPFASLNAKQDAGNNNVPVSCLTYRKCISYELKNQQQKITTCSFNLI